MNELTLLSGTANPELSKNIAKHFNAKLTDMLLSRFADGEFHIQIKENVRGKNCFILQPTCPPVNENLMQLLLITDALRRSSAKSITAVIPYFGYGRQDRKSASRVPISAKLVSNLIVASGVNRILAMDLHAGQIQGFFDIPVDHLYGMPVFIEYFNSKKFKFGTDNIVIVSPDAGGVERARGFAKKLDCTLAIVDKRRPEPNKAAIMHIIGNVKDKTAIIVDDMVDTAGTLIKVATAIRNKGARHVVAACSHGILSGDAIKNINESCIEELIISDSVPLANKNDKITVLTISSLFAEAIKRIHEEQSISALFM